MEKIVHEEGNCTRKIEIRVSSAEIEEKYNSVMKSLISKADIPGFRQGKAPRAIIEKKYGQAVLEDMQEEFVKNGFTEALKENNLQPLVQAELEGEPQLVLGEDFIAIIIVDVKPEINLREYKNIPLTRKVRAVAEEDVDTIIENIRYQHGQLAPVEDRPSKAGDYVFVEFHPNDDEEHSKRVFRLDDSATVVLLDKKVGDEIEGHFEFPQDWPDNELAGNIYDAKVKILELKEVVPAELDEEFISNFGEDVKDVAGFRAHVRNEMEAAAKDDAERELRRSVRNELAARNPIEFPERFVDEAVLRTIRNHWKVEELSPEQLDEIKKNMRPQTISAITTDFIIDEIAEKEGIDVSEEELKEVIAKIAKANNIQPDALYRHWKKEDKLDDVRDDLIAGKVIDLVLEHATITEE